MGEIPSDTNVLSEHFYFYDSEGCFDKLLIWKEGKYLLKTYFLNDISN